MKNSKTLLLIEIVVLNFVHILLTVIFGMQCKHFGISEDAGYSNIVTCEKVCPRHLRYRNFKDMQDSQIFYYSALRHLRQITFNKSVIRWIAPQTWMLYKKHVMLAQQICKKKHVKLFSWEEFIHKMNFAPSYYYKHILIHQLWAISLLGKIFLLY